MPRAKRTVIPGHVWHITERCHDRGYLLRFVRDRRRWRHWLFEARKRVGLCVLNYSMLPVTGAWQLNTSGAQGSFAMSSKMGAYA